MQFVVKKCVKCNQERKFLKDSERDLKSICGECWDWTETPLLVYLTPKEYAKLKELLKDI
jgi:hypothetical protein